MELKIEFKQRYTVIERERTALLKKLKVILRKDMEFSKR